MMSLTQKRTGANMRSEAANPFCDSAAVRLYQGIVLSHEWPTKGGGVT